MKRYPVHRKELEKGARIEQKEHPWASETRARRIARDHLQSHPRYYAVEPVAENMMTRSERRIRPIRRKRAPRPFNPLTDGLPF